MNVGYKHTPHNYKSSTASGLIVSKGPRFSQKHRPVKFSGYMLALYAPDYVTVHVAGNSSGAIKIYIRAITL